MITDLARDAKTPLVANLPKGWRLVRLDQASVPQLVKGEQGSTPYLEIGDINIVDKSYACSSKGAVKGALIAERGDVLISRVRPTRGAIVVLRESQAHVSSALSILRPIPEVLSSYLFYFLAWNRSFAEYLGSHCTGTMYPTVSKDVVNSYHIPLAPIDEQHDIIEELEKQFSRLDEAIASLKRVKANLKRYKAAVLKAAVEGKLSEEWRKQHPDVEPASKLLERVLAERRNKWKGRGKYKDPAAPDITKLPRLPTRWIWSSVETICAEVVDCPHSTPKWESNGRVCLRTTEFLPGRLDLRDVRYVSQATYEKRIQRLKPEANDIVYSREGGILGVACMIPSGLETCLGQRMMLLRSHDSVTPNFLMHWLNSPWVLARIRSLTGGSASPHLNVEEVKGFPAPLPPLAEQQCIVAEVERRLSVVEELEAVETANLQRSARLRQAILRMAFSGQLSFSETA